VATQSISVPESVTVACSARAGLAASATAIAPITPTTAIVLFRIVRLPLPFK
jgi:hypothetical protein